MAPVTANLFADGTSGASAKLERSECVQTARAERAHSQYYAYGKFYICVKARRPSFDFWPIFAVGLCMGGCRISTYEPSTRSARAVRHTRSARV
jgi:hypothetical protein